MGYHHVIAIPDHGRQVPAGLRQVPGLGLVTGLLTGMHDGIAADGHRDRPHDLSYGHRSNKELTPGRYFYTYGIEAAMPEPTAFSQRWGEFRQSRNGLYFGVALMLLVTALVFWYSVFLCFGYLLVALLMYGVPNYFGLKGLKSMLILGMTTLIVLTLVMTTQYFFLLQEDPGDVSSADGLLVNGNADPYRADYNSTVRFSVTMVGATNESQVFLNYRNLWKENELINETTVHSGEYFYFDVIVTEGFYEYQFSTDNGTAWVFTSAGAGPLVETDSDLFVRLLPNSALFTFINVGMIYFIFALVFDWARKARIRIKDEIENREVPLSAGMPQEKFVCDQCGGEVPGEAKECPHCGEPFDEEEGIPTASAQQFICSECGADVSGEAKECPHCGERFED